MDSVDRLSSALAGRYEIERTFSEGGMATVYGNRFVVLTGQSRPQRLIVALNPFAPAAQRR